MTGEVDCPEQRRAARTSRLWSLLAGPALILAGAILYVALAATPAKGGWTLRRWDNDRFEGKPASVRVVDEPFERDEPTAPFSAQWASWLKVERSGRYQFVVEADDSVELRVDGASLFRAAGRRGRTEHTGTIALNEGEAVPVVLRLVDYGGGKYLRVFWYELDSPHAWSPVPLPHGVAFASPELALAARKPMDETARMWLFGFALALATLGAALGARALADRFEWPGPCRKNRMAALAVVLVALGARLNGLSTADLYCDETAYLKAGMHYVRNVELGDFAPQSFRWNKEHPPVAKWLYGAAERAGGLRGAKFLSAWLQVLTCLVVFWIGRRYGSLAVGVSAGMLLALMPYFIGHGRAVGLESPLTFFFTLSALLLMLACERNSWWLHAAWGLTSILGVGSRATGVWFAPLALLVCGVALARRRSRFRPMLGALVGVAVGVSLLFTGWPWLWHDPIAQAQRTWGHWSAYVPEEWVLGTRRALPFWYYGFAFLVTNPTLHLALALVWLGFALRRRSTLDWLILGWLLFPFGQSLSSMRQDGARYVIQAFPALALAVAVGLQQVVERLRKPRLGWAAHPVLWLYTAGAMLSVHPYEIDYSSEWTGGVGAVMERRWLEIPFWGEGHRELADALHRIAPPGASVHLKLAQRDDFPRLRRDLKLAPEDSADYVLMNYFMYPEEPKGLSRVYEVRAGSGTIAAIYRREHEDSPERENVHTSGQITR